jgi:hypothetical protein
MNPQPPTDYIRLVQEYVHGKYVRTNLSRNLCLFSLQALSRTQVRTTKLPRKKGGIRLQLYYNLAKIHLFLAICMREAKLGAHTYLISPSVRVAKFCVFEKLTGYMVLLSVHLLKSTDGVFGFSRLKFSG